MNQKFTAEEVRAEADFLSTYSRKTSQMLTAYADSIEADDGSAAIWQYRHTFDAQWLDCDELDADAWKQTGLHEVRKLFAHPPAQAAQVDALRWLAVSCDPHKLTGAFAVDHARRAFGMCPFKDDPSYAATEPAQPTDSGRVAAALRGLLEIGKRDLTNPKYDGFWNEAHAALAAQKFTKP